MTIVRDRIAKEASMTDAATHDAHEVLANLMLVATIVGGVVLASIRHHEPTPWRPATNACPVPALSADRGPKAGSLSPSPDPVFFRRGLFSS